MTGLARSITRWTKKATPKELPKDPLIKKTEQKSLDTNFMPRPPIAPAEAVIPLPDEEEIVRARRRRRAGRTGRAATVLTGGDADTVG